jgi:hypothetical protein
VVEARQVGVSWNQFEREVSAYGDETGIPTEARPFVQSLQEKLISTSRNTDERFPQSESVRIENEEPMLSPLGARHEPEDLSVAETWIKERMRHVDIIDALVDTEHCPALDSSVTIENTRDNSENLSNTTHPPNGRLTQGVISHLL